MEEYDDGVRAYEDEGKCLSDNPFEKGSEAHSLWAMGWQDARQHSTDIYFGRVLW